MRIQIPGTLVNGSFVFDPKGDEVDPSLSIEENSARLEWYRVTGTRKTFTGIPGTRCIDPWYKLKGIFLKLYSYILASSGMVYDAPILCLGVLHLEGGL